MARSNSPRASQRQHVLKVLRALKTKASHLQRCWGVRGEVYTGAGYRPREAHEYPENIEGDWAYLVHQIDDMRAGLLTLRQQAYEQYAELRDQNNKEAGR